MRPLSRIFGLLLALAACPSAAFAQDGGAASEEVVFETETDKEVREVARQLRCAVCQSESVADSNSTLARNMRAIIRERVEAGDSAEEVKAYFVSKYGDYILMEPRRTGFNWALWLFPFVALAIGFLVIRARMQQAKHAPAAPADAPAVEDHTQELIAALREPAAEKDTENK